jgi:LacI family transcriptional regulator
MTSHQPSRTAATICAVLSEHLSNHYVGPFARGAVAAAAELGVRLILYSPLSIYLNRRHFTLEDLPLLPQHVDAYLFPANIADEVVAVCQRAGAALLTYAGARPGLPAIGPDNRAGARAATAHLIGHGRRQIAHLAGLPDSDEAHERLQGYQDALAEAGLPFDPALVAYGCFRVQEAEDAVDQLLADGVVFDAIFAANDLEARGAIAALARAGRNVPADVAIAGFDDAAGSDVLRPPLTTVRQSAFQLGWDAIELLATTGQAALPARTSTPVQLVVRQSCGCAPTNADAGDWAAALAQRLAPAQGPLIGRDDALVWVADLERALDGASDWAAALATTVDLVERRGGHAWALRDYLDAWRVQRAAGDLADRTAAVTAAAKDVLAQLLEERALHERLERGRRLNVITYVLDLLREYNNEQSGRSVLRYMADGGPRAALSAQRAGSADTIGALRVSAAGAEQWHGPATAFPPPEWLSPGEVALLMPMESGAQQRALYGVVEGTGRAHIDLDDQLLRSINTYRSITVLDETRRELDAARSVQLSLLPRQAPASDHYDVAGATRAARQVGGDLYGYYVRAEGELALALGDVAGKGMPAALLMSACATALAGTIQRGLSPGQTLAQIHQMLLPSLGPGQNAAICLAFLDGPRAWLANAGAVAPVVLDNSGARLADIGGPPLGTALAELRPYAELRLSLAPGELLILSSDGIVEAMNAEDELYGFERFTAAIARGPRGSAQHMLEHLFADVAAFTGEAEPHDDMAIVVARYLG